MPSILYFLCRQSLFSIAAVCWASHVHDLIPVDEPTHSTTLKGLNEYTNYSITVFVLLEI